MNPKKVTLGAPLQRGEFPGGSFNALVDEFYRTRALPNKGRPNRGSAANSILTVMVKNSSGADREPGQVLGIDSVLFTYTEDNGQVYRGPLINGIVPTTEDHANRFVILKDHIDNGKIGPAWMIGMDWGKVDVTDADHKFAKVKDADATSLESGGGGPALIIYKEKQAEDGSARIGVQWVLLEMGGGGGDLSATFMIVTTAITAATGDITEITPGDGEAQPYTTDPDTGVRTPLGDPIRVLNYDPCETYTERTGIYVAVPASGGEPEVISAFCCLFDPEP